MRTSKLILGIALVLVLSGDALAAEKKYRDTISGTAVPSSFESNNDLYEAHYVTFSGLSNLGLIHGSFLVEYDFVNMAPDAACPAGTLKLPIVVSASTRSTPLGDQLFLRDDETSALFCLNPGTGEFTMSLSGTFTGGMGKFKGATGTYSSKGSGQVLLSDKNMKPYGAFVAKTEGKVVLP